MKAMFIDIFILNFILDLFIGLTGLSMIGGLAYCLWWIRLGRFHNSSINKIDHLDKYFPTIKLT